MTDILLKNGTKTPIFEERSVSQLPVDYDIAGDEDSETLSTMSNRPQTITIADEELSETQLVPKQMFRED